MARRRCMLILISFCIAAQPLYSYEIFSGNNVGSISINSTFAEALRKLNDPQYKEVKEKKVKDFFNDVLGLPEAGILPYHSLCYCSGLNLMLVVNNGKVSACAVTAEEGMLEGVIDVKRGIEPVLVFYGSAEMKVIKRNNHRVYIYKSRGIMFFDDNSDGTIDMIIIWKK